MIPSINHCGRCAARYSPVTIAASRDRAGCACRPPPLPGRRWLVVFEARHFDVDVDAVEQGAGDALLVPGDRAERAGAGRERVAVVAAGEGVHGGDEHVVFTIGTERYHLS